MLKAHLPYHDPGSSHSSEPYHPGKLMAIRTNQPQRWGPSFSSHTTGPRTSAAWNPGHNHRRALASAPTADVCCPVWPTRLGTAGSTAVGPDPPKTPTSSARQTPPTDVDSHAQNYARSGSLDFSAY